MTYGTAFFDDQEEGSRRSARVILPWVLARVQPASVVDVGCGLGTWLEVALEAGVQDVLGLDGDYVARDRLRVPPACFQACDLGERIVLPHRYDLAISLEVAEHLADGAAATYVASLVDAAPVVLFSAAIPGQGGTHHVNERWPTYWAELFGKMGYLVADIRPFFWAHPEVCYWYRQNVLIFAEPAALDRSPSLRFWARQTMPGFLDLVHPEFLGSYHRYS